MADVLFVARNDWANVAFHYANAMNRIGVSAKAIKEFPHQFYKAQAEVVIERGRIKAMLKQAKCVCVMHTIPHSALKAFEPILREKFVAVFHGGKTYRHGYKKWNAYFNKRVGLTMIQTHDLLGLGAQNEQWVNLAIDVAKIQPRYYRGGKYVVGHYPRHAKLKQTQAIQRAIKEVVDSYRARQKRAPFRSRVNTGLLPWDNNMNRMALCDIYLGSMSMKDPQGHPTGEWGLTAIEAAALGDVVLTAFIAKESYEKEFGPCPMPKITSHQDLVRQLKGAVAGGPEALIQKQHAYREWAEETCSYEAVGHHLKKLFAQGLT